MARIKIGQIGIGHNHAAENMNALRSLADVFDVVGVVEPDPEWKLKRGTLKAYEGLTWMTEEELFSTPGLQAVAVETDGFELVPTAQRCAQRGLHLHLDKPGGESLKAFRTLLDTSASQNLAIQLAYVYRYNPAIQFCMEAARAGWLGDRFEIHAVMSRYDGERDDYRKWLAQFQGGSMYIFGGYLIDLVVSLLGRPDNVTAFQRKTRQDSLFDNGLAVLEYPRATATIRTSVAEVDGMKHRRLIICGTKGTVEVCPLEHPADRYRLDPLHVRLTVKEGNAKFAAGTHLVDVGVMNGRYEAQLLELARIIRGEISNPYPVEHEWIVQETRLAAAGYKK
jgi:predicted dehydrogenase